MDKLGSQNRPIKLFVHTREEGKRLSLLCNKNGWYHRVILDSWRPRNVEDLYRALGVWKARETQQKIGRNDPCPCGSAIKYKKCCLDKASTISSPNG